MVNILGSDSICYCDSHEDEGRSISLKNFTFFEGTKSKFHQGSCNPIAGLDWLLGFQEVEAPGPLRASPGL